MLLFAPVHDRTVAAKLARGRHAEPVEWRASRVEALHLALVGRTELIAVLVRGSAFSAIHLLRFHGAARRPPPAAQCRKGERPPSPPAERRRADPPPWPDRRTRTRSQARPAQQEADGQCGARRPFARWMMSTTEVACRDGAESARFRSWRRYRPVPRGWGPGRHRPRLCLIPFLHARRRAVLSLERMSELVRSRAARFLVASALLRPTAGRPGRPPWASAGRPRQSVDPQSTRPPVGRRPPPRPHRTARRPGAYMFVPAATLRSCHRSATRRHSASSRGCGSHHAGSREHPLGATADCLLST